MKIFSFADVGHREAFPFFIQRATVEAGAFEMHGHHFSELVVVLSGSGRHVTEAESYPICRGDVFVLNGRTSHAFEDSSRLKLCNVMFDPDQLIRPHQKPFRRPRLSSPVRVGASVQKKLRLQRQTATERG